jgi:hypothetical protein
MATSLMLLPASNGAEVEALKSTPILGEVCHTVQHWMKRLKRYRLPGDYLSLLRVTMVKTLMSTNFSRVPTGTKHCYQ